MSRSTPHGCFPPILDPSCYVHASATITTLTRMVYANHVRLCNLTKSLENVLAQIETGMNVKAPYKFHGLTDLTEIA
jgi:hypothetical protein